VIFQAAYLDAGTKFRHIFGPTICSNEQRNKKEIIAAMRTVPIPNTDLIVSALCLGTSDLGTRTQWDDARKMLNTFVDAGGRFFDSARVYAEWIPGGRHASEKTLGRWLKESGQRGKVVVATKGAHPELKTMHIPRMSPEEITIDVEGSLSNLGVDRIDLWYLHRDDPSRPVEEILDTLWNLVDAGKIHYIACSNWTLPRLKAAHAYAQKKERAGFVANQPLWNAAVVNPNAFDGQGGIVVMDDATKAWHQETQTAAIPFSSQANGLFQKLAQNGGDFAALPGGPRATYGLSDNLRRLERFQKLSQETDLSLTQLTLGYLQSHPFPVSAIVGPRDLTQLADTLTAANIQLTPTQAASIEGP
jgi:aryl-alcohol dehydrogenase-like predicted oxidoreductase